MSRRGYWEKEVSSSAEDDGAFHLEPTFPCGSQNRRTPRSRLPVLSAAPSPACCFPPCGRSQTVPFEKGRRRFPVGHGGQRILKLPASVIDYRDRRMGLNALGEWENASGSWGTSAMIGMEMLPSPYGAGNYSESRPCFEDRLYIHGSGLFPIAGMDHSSTDYTSRFQAQGIRPSRAAMIVSGRLSGISSQGPGSWIWWR